MSRLVPYLYDFTTESIQKVISDQSSLRTVIGLSGGLDSTTATLVVAESMRRAKNLGNIKNNSLVLLSFRGMSEEDLIKSRIFAEQVGSKYKDLSVDYQETDLTKLLKEINGFTDRLVTVTKKPKVYSGELATRLISSCVLEYADKTGHCAIDTTNGTEVILGEFVIGAGGDCSLLSDLYKSQVYDLAELIGVPSEIINRPPVNSTFGNDKISSYFGEVPDGLSPRDAYAVLDPVLHLIYDKKYGPKRISRDLGHSLKFIEKIYGRVKAQDHRRSTPFFTLYDKYRKFTRTAKNISNKDLRYFLEGSFSIS